MSQVVYRAASRPTYHTERDCDKLAESNKAIAEHEEEYARQFWDACEICTGEWEAKHAAANHGAAEP